ncbi:hypothetical protein [Microbacterium saperdae]|uniref:Integral membrane protein n=1 Tax=Microbacterium saperdae TaxID=69368 RepID=A0A543BBW3_9MICO|nr:hypothetical protein [Microbacterium saperdae]TQL82317.1 hypothetical protein FB560_3801 [Microbacterium saperdae]GGM38881.1 hypothetical protein GCM10010489_07360 [Microbacterium saperdae]
MGDRRSPTGALFTAAAVAYAANCALGVSVATKAVDTSGFRWVHHALYIATCAATAAALSTAVWARPRRQSRRAALALAPAVVPLAAIPYLGSRSRRHPLTALAAAPFIAAGLLCAWRPADRK